MQLPTVELQANDGKHEDGKKEQQADLEERHHGLHDGFQDNLQAWERREKGTAQNSKANPLPGTHPSQPWQKEDREQRGWTVNREMQEPSTAWRISLSRRILKESTIAGEGKPSCRAKLQQRLFLVPTPTSCLSLPHLDLVGHGLCSSVPLVVPKAQIQPCQCPGQERKEDWCQQQPSFFIYPHANR